MINDVAKFKKFIIHTVKFRPYNLESDFVNFFHIKRFGSVIINS